uniref:Proton-coupled amino acid transporter 4 n=1 Tax=Cacopsylla melanoneura TaxID=428564 RepID=A0A8D8UX78_9HEMI
MVVGSYSINDSREYIADNEVRGSNMSMSTGGDAEAQKKADNAAGGDDDYEPYANRNVKHPTSYGDTLFHIMKASLGTGILALPSAFRNAGYVTGVVGTLVIGFFCTYCVHLLVGAQYELCRRRKIPSLTYPQIAEVAIGEGPTRLRWLAPYGRKVTLVFLILCEVGANCIYVIFVASNLKAVFDHYYGDHDVRLYVLAIFLPLLLLCWVRNLKFLAPFSAFASGVTIISFGITLYYVFTDIPSLKDRTEVAGVHELPLFFGTVMFSMSAIGIIMPLENEMKKPKNFTSTFGVLNVAMLSIALIYAAFGFFGYLKYGEEVLGSITLNLPPTEILAQSVRIMQSVAIFCTFAIPHYIVFDIMWNRGIKLKLEKNKCTLFWEYVFRSAIVILTFLSAVMVPNLELFISFNGALCLPFMSIGFPAIVDLFTFWDHRQGSDKVILVLKNCLVMLIGLVGFVTGVNASVRAMIHEYYKTV